MISVLSAFNTHNDEKHMADVGGIAVTRNEKSVSKNKAFRDFMKVRKADAGKDRWHVNTWESHFQSSRRTKRKIS